MEKEITFHQLRFGITEQGVMLNQMYGLNARKSGNHRRHILSVQLAGGNFDSHLGDKFVCCSENSTLKYSSHQILDDCLTIVQRNAHVEVVSRYTAYRDTDAIRCQTEVKNITDRPIVLEHVSSFVGYGFGERGLDSDELYFYKFINSHHAECQPRRLSFWDLGLFRDTGNSQKSVSFSNVGTWSTKEALPQGIVEDASAGNFFMFQIESNHDWHYEIGDYNGEYYINLCGGEFEHHQWNKVLMPDQSYSSPYSAIAFSSTLNGVLAEMTKYRRHIVTKNVSDEALPVIFNEYMHLSWDSPNEARTRSLIPVIKYMGASYYVIDCGWHNEEAGDKVYPYVGQWKESKARFPHGMKAIMDEIHSHGLKAGLWIEPEVVGYLCEEMKGIYDDDCFFRRNGKRVTKMGRQFLDFRNDKVKGYMTEVFRRMVEDYGADYIKFDYNQDAGAGTEWNSSGLGDGLEKAQEAYCEWVKSEQKKYPNVIIETCSSGGMRMDYKTLSLFSLVSTSDQTDYKKYPYIVGNILSAVLPEQAAVWSYPVDSLGCPNSPVDLTFEGVNKRVDKEVVAMNMINSFLGRMHLASHVELLSKEKQELIEEGIAYYRRLTPDKKAAVPYLPFGFTDFRAKRVASGFRTDKKLYLAVWNLGGERKIKVPLPPCSGGGIGYPKDMPLPYSLTGEGLEIEFTQDYQARFFELDLV